MKTRRHEWKPGKEGYLAVNITAHFSLHIEDHVQLSSLYGHQSQVPAPSTPYYAVVFVSGSGRLYPHLVDYETSRDHARDSWIDCLCGTR